MAKGYTKRHLTKPPRASQRGRIVRRAFLGRQIMTVERELPDGSTIEVGLHATKGLRVRRSPPSHLMAGVVTAG